MKLRPIWNGHRPNAVLLTQCVDIFKAQSEPIGRPTKCSALYDPCLDPRLQERLSAVSARYQAPGYFRPWNTLPVALRDDFVPPQASCEAGSGKSSDSRRFGDDFRCHRLTVPYHTLQRSDGQGAPSHMLPNSTMIMVASLISISFRQRPTDRRRSRQTVFALTWERLNILQIYPWSFERAVSHTFPCRALAGRPTLVSSPASHHFPEPQSESLLQTQVPFAPSTALHLPSLQASSL